ncbi:MAG: 50S ribosomal protein L10 [Gammaproteobacteria bacterium RIFCSPHIGHO2_12_FULL_35_23]|nr:MAG: 50S ribosomal protein L10 [Gammaproteobacteria bacterium RIFCSPHIGHO2_12_FULL_35_23]
MALRLEDKKAIVAQVAQVANNALSAAAAHYRGLTVTEMNELRSKAREAKVYLRVIRNTLARRAFENTDFACMSEVLTGPLLLAFSLESPGAAARLFRDFAKEHEKLEVRALSLEGKLLGADQLKAVASLPTKEEALAMLLSVMKAPISKFVRTLVEPQSKLVRTIAAVRESKEKAA